jgi:hypothetical protein
LWHQLEQALPALVAAVEQQQLHSLEHACGAPLFLLFCGFVREQRAAAM